MVLKLFFMDLKYLCILVDKIVRIVYFFYFDLKSDMIFNYDYLYISICIVIWYFKLNILGGIVDIIVY